MKKNVLVVGPEMCIGGIERSLVSLLNNIDYSSYKVDLFLRAQRGELMPYVNSHVNLLPEFEDFTYISWPIAKLALRGKLRMATIRLISKLQGSIRAKRTHTRTLSITLCIEKLVAHMPAYNKHYHLAFSFLDPHYLIEDKVHADVKVGWIHTDYSSPHERPDVQYVLPMWSKLDYIACVSQQVKASFDNLFPTLTNKTVVIENILDENFIVKQAQEFSVEAEMSKKEGRVCVLSVGRFSVQKHFTCIPEVVASLEKRGVNVEWYLIGYGPEDNLIREQIKQWGMEDRVVILGKKDNPYPYIDACDIYVQPSRYEGKAVAVREAQILGKPVMITRFATSSSQVEEGVDGFICENSIEGVVEGLQYLIENPSVCAALAQTAAQRSYSNKGQIDKLFALEKRS